MAAMSDFLESALAAHIFKNTAFATPGNSLFVAAFVGDNGLEAGTLTSEVAGGAYARQQVVAAGWTQTGGVVANTAAVEFPLATASWGTVTHVAIMSAITGGNVLVHGLLASSRVIGNGDQLKFAAGDLTLTFL
ncbi:MAG: hypothetical protein H0U69_03505 [Trueperaceae bacterium]|nr:hypothetical protein [Trueperaceae bacterium]